MRQSATTLKCHILDTGYCLAWEHHVIQGGQRRRIACHSIAVLLCHPEYGWLLWDTGYAPRLLEVTRRLPYLLYRYVTPLRVKSELAVVLCDFAAAEFIVSQAAYEYIASRRGMRALTRAFIPALLPGDFCARATLLPPFEGPALPALGPTHDLLGDGSLLLVQLPGHARGQMGLLAHTERGRILFAADACWLRRSIFERRPPARITNLLVDDAHAVRSTIDCLHDFALTYPDVVIVPSHCPETFAQEVEQYYESN